MNGLLRTPRSLAGFLAALALTATATAQTPAETPPTDAPATYIVQAESLDAARTHVRRVGAVPERDLEIIHAVAVRLTPAQVARLRENSNVRVFDDRAVRTRGTSIGSR